MRNLGFVVEDAVAAVHEDLRLPFPNNGVLIELAPLVPHVRRRRSSGPLDTPGLPRGGEATAGRGGEASKADDRCPPRPSQNYYQNWVHAMAIRPTGSRPPPLPRSPGSEA